MALVEKHCRATRWTHWLNALWLAFMLWSGLLIYWANDVYRVGPVPFFPAWFYRAFSVDHRLAEGMALHFAFLWPFFVTGLVYVVFTLASGEWRHLRPGRRGVRDAVAVVLHDLHLRRRLPAQGRYNAAQRVAYTVVIVMGAGSLLTGLAIYRPVQLRPLPALFGGYEGARAVHFALAVGFVAFLVVHVVQVARAGWPNLRSMLTGYDVHPAKPPPDEAP